MRIENLLLISDEINKKARELLVAKNTDYAFSNDVYYNFNTLTELCKIFDIDVKTPIGVIKFFILHKLVRLMKLAGGNTRPKNESLIDTDVDLRNYMDLLIGKLKEGKNEKETEERKKRGKN